MKSAWRSRLKNWSITRSSLTCRPSFDVHGVLVFYFVLSPQFSMRRVRTADCGSPKSLSRRFLGHFQAGASEVNESDSILAEGCRESCMEQCEMGTENCTACKLSSPSRGPLFGGVPGLPDSLLHCPRLRLSRLRLLYRVLRNVRGVACC